MIRLISLFILGFAIAASITQIPWMLTIYTAIFWIYAVASPIAFFTNLAQFEELKNISIGDFLVSTAFSFIALGVYAYLGWAWIFGWVMLAFVVCICAAFANKEVK